MLALLALGLSVAADEAPPVGLFALPKVGLRPAAASTNQVSPAGSAAATESSKGSDGKTEDFSVTRTSAVLVTEANVQAYETMNGGPVLRATERPVELGGAAGWLNENVWEPVFAPEVIKVGKVYMSGGVIAAVKRKNPFCLLNPLVFIASW